MDNKEKYEYIRNNISVVDFARRCGFTPIKKGKYYSLKEHDSVIIDTRKNCYWQNSVAGSGSSIGKGGSVIDFAINLCNMTVSEAIKTLENELNISDFAAMPLKKNQQKEITSNALELPPKADNYKKVFAYLIKTRKINADIVKTLVDRGYIYQDKHNNCVFVGFDINNPEEPVFATKRGTNTFKPFYGDVLGSDYSRCWFVSNNSEILCVTEAVIDALSVMTLSGNSNNYDYLALGGVGKWKSIDTYLSTGKYKMIYLSLDNDQKGIQTMQEMSSYIERTYPNVNIMKVIPPKQSGKDWNEVLQGNS